MNNHYSEIAEKRCRLSCSEAKEHCSLDGLEPAPCAVLEEDCIRECDSEYGV